MNAGWSKVCWGALVDVLVPPLSLSNPEYCGSSSIADDLVAVNVRSRCLCDLR